MQAKMSPEAQLHQELASLRQRCAQFDMLIAIQQRSLEAQQQLALQFRTLVEAAPQGLMIHRDNTPLFVNQAWTDIFGYATPQAILCMPTIVPLIAPAERQRLQEYYTARIHGEAVPPHYEFQGMQQDGTTLWLDCKATRVIWEGEPATLLAVADITGRKQAELALRQSEERYRELIEGSPQGIVIHRNLRPLFANQACADLVGYDTPADLLQLDSLLTFVLPQDQERVRHNAQARLAGHTIGTPHEQQIIRKDGRHLWIEVKTHTIQWDGEAAMQVTMSDMSARKHAEMAIRTHVERLQVLTRLNQLVSSALRLEDVLREIAQAAVVLMQAPVVSFWIADAATCSLDMATFSDPTLGADFPIQRLAFGQGGIGWTAQQQCLLHVPNVFADARITGLDWWQRHHLQSFLGIPIMRGNEVLAVLALNGRQPFVLEAAEHSLLESFVAQAAIAITNAQLFHEVQRHAEELTQANTELQRSQALLQEQQRREKQQIEAELAKVRDQLVAQTRLSTLGQVAGTMAHELRNPLGAARNAVYYLRRYAVKDELMLGEFLRIIEVEISVADQIISNLLEMSRAKQPITQDINIVQMADDVLSRLKDAANVRVRYVLEPTPFVVHADPTQLHQVFTNLMANAVQAMHGVGDLCICGQRDAVWDTLTFQDDGPGIPATLHARLFEPLFSTKAKGTGLGLAICRQILEQHGGTIDLVDSPRGAAFRLRLPRGR